MLAWPLTVCAAGSEVGRAVGWSSVSSGLEPVRGQGDRAAPSIGERGRVRIMPIAHHPQLAHGAVLEEARSLAQAILEEDPKLEHHPALEECLAAQRRSLAAAARLN